MGAATKRLGKEYGSMLEQGLPAGFKDVSLVNNNLLSWTVRALPGNPYTNGSFIVSLEFPLEFPFKPPKVLLKTKIYHPNVDDNGQICLPIVNPENWKPATKVKKILECLMCLLEQPDPHHALKSDIGEEYLKNKDKFLRRAEKFTHDHALQR